MVKIETQDTELTSYKEKLKHHIKNTIELFNQYIDESTYRNFIENVEYYNKEYTNRVNEFFTSNNIDSKKFFECLNYYDNLQMLKKLDINNIILNFKKYWLTEREIMEKPLYCRLNNEELDNIRIWLFNNSYKNDMLSLEEQNKKMKNYIHFDAGMKKIKTI